MNRRSIAFAAAVPLGGAALWTALTIMPSSHDFGQVVINETKGYDLALTGYTLSSTAPAQYVVKFTGRDAGDFSIDKTGAVLGPLSPAFQPGVLKSTCYDASFTSVKSCNYRVDFRPQTPGKKTAQLVVQLNGETATATLTGEGIFGCQPHLVACNYAYSYSGTVTVATDEAAPSGNRRGHWRTSLDIRVDRGVATCIGVQNDWEEEWGGAQLNKRWTASGTISGPGMFAIEFRKERGGPLTYVMSFSCPSPTLKTTEVDHISGTSSNGSSPSEPADWRHAGPAADPQPASQIGMSPLSGLQKDPRADDGTGSGVTGMTTITWSLTRW